MNIIISALRTTYRVIMEGLKKLMEETARKRKGLQDRGPKSKKYMKKSDLERIQTSGESSEIKETPTVATPTSKREGAVLVSPTSLIPVEDSPIFSIPKSEVARRLREREEPIRLFGETDREVCLRLRQIEILVPEVNKGMRNDFKDALDKIDADYLVQLAKQEGMEGADTMDLKVRDDHTTIEDIRSQVSDLEGDDDNKKQEMCHRTLRFLLNEWAKELNSKSSDKRNFQNKRTLATFRQTESYLTPLMRQLRHKKTSPDILAFMAKICAHVLNREYVQANDAYLSMAIGNAPWPIGVTMVGIHARTGREKIFSQQIAHVLNDETQRKYIQGVKRLMTFSQQKFITNPSKCVEYQASSLNTQT